MKRKATVCQIDQSGKIEQTERHTVIACTNEVGMTILLKKREKRKLQKIFKMTDVQKLFAYLTFAALLAILIKEVNPKHKIIIDREYVGHERLIEEKMISYLQNLGAVTVPSVEFGHVGKTSLAHNLAHRVAVGKKVPTLVVDAKEVLNVILGIKKTGTA